MVMNPREIEPVMLALNELDVPQIRVIQHTEKEIETIAFREVLNVCDEDGFDWMWIVSDDVIVRPQALDAVRRLRDRGHRVVTGYSQRSHTDWIVNLTKTPLRGPHPSEASYDFYEFAEVVSWNADEVPTFFAGMSLTGMAVDDWKALPFMCFGGDGSNTGYASDFHLSARLQNAAIPIVAARDAFMYHWRTDWKSTMADHPPRFDDKRIEVV